MTEAAKRAASETAEELHDGKAGTRRVVQAASAGSGVQTVADGAVDGFGDQLFHIYNLHHKNWNSSDNHNKQHWTT